MFKDKNGGKRWDSDRIGSNPPKASGFWRDLAKICSANFSGGYQDIFFFTCNDSTLLCAKMGQLNIGVHIDAISR